MKITILAIGTQGDVQPLIAREKELKGWSRKKKENLIKTLNPLWDDLADDWYDDL